MLLILAYVALSWCMVLQTRAWIVLAVSPGLLLCSQSIGSCWHLMAALPHRYHLSCQTCCLTPCMCQVPLLVQAATFTAFALLSGRLLTPELAFPALALLNQLSMPLFFLPDQIGAFVQGRVSIKRIQAFLNEPEMEQLPCLPAAAKGEAALTCQHGEYCWEPGACRICMRPAL